MGNYSKAESMYQEAIEISTKVLGKNHSKVIKSLNNLAELYHDTDNYPRAESMYQEALECWRNGPVEKSNSKFMRSLNSVARMYKDILNKDHPDYATILNNLAKLYHDMGNYSKAESMYQEALEIRSKVLGKNHPDCAVTLNNIGLLYAATGRQNEALTFMSDVIAIHDSMLWDILSISSERQRMAFMRIISDDLHYFLSLVSRYFGNSSNAINLAFNLVISRKALGAEVSAIQHNVVLSDGCDEDIRAKIRELNSLRNQINMKTMSGPNINESLDTYNLRLGDLNMIKEELEGQICRNIPMDILQEKLMLADRNAITEALTKYPEAALIEFVRFNEFDFLASSSRGESKWKKAHYLAFILLSNETNNVHMIDLGEANTIDKIIGISNDSFTNEEQANIDAQNLTNSRNLIPFSKISIHVSGLREAVFDPLSALIRDRKRLFIAPDGDLSRLSFEALRTCDGKRYLIDDYIISYLSTSRDIIRFNQTIDMTRSSEPLVVADPDFDLNFRRFGIITMYLPSTTIRDEDRPISRHSRELDGNILHFQRLEGTNQEGNMVSGLLGVKPCIKEKVLEGYIKSYTSPHILHIATHGFFLPNKIQNKITNRNMEEGGSGNTTSMIHRISVRNLENPMLRSGLALAGANSWLQDNPLPIDAEDGMLTAEDVSMMDLSNTELVVLSACETGLGEVLVGEGVFGLRRAFVLAGARSLIMTLWKVSDEETKDLMIDLYKRLLAGKSRAEALREAQLAMKEKNPDPYYWGAFICQGNPEPLSNELIKRVKEKINQSV
jgi:CHAT domain-containing protein